MGTDSINVASSSFDLSEKGQPKISLVRARQSQVGIGAVVINKECFTYLLGKPGCFKASINGEVSKALLGRYRSCERAIYHFEMSPTLAANVLNSSVLAYGQPEAKAGHFFFRSS